MEPDLAKIKQHQRQRTDLHRDLLVLAGHLGGEHVRYLGVGRGLPADGTFDGSPPRAHAVLLHDDGDALVAEAVAAGQHGPLGKNKKTRPDIRFL